MNKSAAKSPAILVLTGASGAGKTTLVLKLNALSIPGVHAFNCDRVVLDLPKTIDPGERQAAVLRHWIGRVAAEMPEIKLAVLDTQIRPHRAREVLDQAGVLNSQIVLVDCEPEIRNERLRGERDQPHLANPQMDCWAAYLRGQADAMRLPIIDTSKDPPDTSLGTLKTLAGKLLAQAGTGVTDFPSQLPAA